MIWDGFDLGLRDVGLGHEEILRRFDWGWWKTMAETSFFYPSRRSVTPMSMSMQTRIPEGRQDVSTTDNGHDG